MRDWLQRVEAEILNRRLFKHGEKLLVAVSGGLDSMVLLHALNELSPRHQWRLVVAHFNHRLRGRASDADEKLVRKTAAALKLTCATGSADVKAFAERSKLSLEMAARKLRHEFLARAAAKRKIKTIAVAHHAGDQVELFFLRLLRGTGGEGLAGMKWRSPSPADPKVALVRPLLGCAKSGLREFARKNNIRFREDATNFSSDFLRNRIRNELLPLLRRKYQPALDQTVLRLMEIAGAEAEFVARSSEREFAQISNQSRLTPAAMANSFSDLPIAIQRRVLHRQLTKRGLAAEFELIESLRRMPNQFISVGPKISAARDESGDIRLRPESEPEFNTGERAVKVTSRPGKICFGGCRLEFRVHAAKANQSLLTPAATRIKRELFDADKVGGKIILRHRRPGDRFQPIGLTSAAKLQDLFVNAKIPRDRRRHLVVAEAAGGDIFWVEGLRIAEGFKLTRATKRVLVWRWQARASGRAASGQPGS